MMVKIDDAWAVLRAGFLQAASPPHPVCRAREQRHRAGLHGHGASLRGWLCLACPSRAHAGPPARPPAPATLRRAGGTHSRAGPGSSRRAATAAKSQLSGPPPPRKVNYQGRRRQTATERENSSASPALLVGLRGVVLRGLGHQVLPGRGVSTPQRPRAGTHVSGARVARPHAWFAPTVPRVPTAPRVVARAPRAGPERSRGR
jgi:hypothetical protein